MATYGALSYDLEKTTESQVLMATEMNAVVKWHSVAKLIATWNIQRMEIESNSFIHAYKQGQESYHDRRHQMLTASTLAMQTLYVHIDLRSFTPNFEGG